MSVDGIGAFDLVSRGAILQGLCDVSPSTVPFVRQFHGRPVYIVCSPKRVSAICAILQEELWTRLDTNPSWKTQVWNRSGNRPVACDVLDRAARALDPEFTTVWERRRRTSAPRHCDPRNALGQASGPNPLSPRCPVRLHCCANARANYALRMIRPELARHFAQAHDARFWRCLCAILRVGEKQCDALAKDAASLPLSLGGWVAQRRAHEQWCTLGELGRFIVYGQGTPPWVANMIVDALHGASSAMGAGRV